MDIVTKIAPASSQEFLQFFARFHNAEPGITERTWGEARTLDGRSSYEVLCDLSEPLAGKTVIDLACGSGPLTVMLASRVGNAGHVIGVDLSEGELDIAQARLRGVHHVRFLQESVQQLSLPSSSTDVVLCHMAFMLFTPLESVVREIARILKPGGTFAAVAPTLGRTNPLYSKLLDVMTAVLREEIPHFEQLRWGEPAARTPTGLTQLFTQELHFLAEEMQTTDFDLVLRDAPQQLAERMVRFYYYGFLLSEEGAARVRAEWQATFERHQGSDGTVTLHLPLSAFVVKRR